MKTWEEEAAEAEKEKRKKTAEIKPAQQEIVFKEPPLIAPWVVTKNLLLVLGGFAALVCFMLVIGFLVSNTELLMGIGYIIATVFGIIYFLSPIIALGYLREIKNEVVKIRREIYRNK